MPLTYMMDEGTRIVRLVGAGTADIAHCDEVSRALARDLATRTGWAIVCDCRELTWMPWPDEIRQLAAILSERRAAYGPLAVVLTRPARFGMARMLATLVEPFGVTMRPFWHAEDAEAWCAARMSDSRE